MTTHDVIIVGGGPAGATAGITLLGKGIKVLLMEKATFPKQKICGGGISMRAIHRFPFLSKHLNEIPVNYIRKVYLQSPNRSEIREERDKPIYFMAKRDAFDSMLLDICKNAGLQVLENTKLRSIHRTENSLALLTGSGDTLTAKLVIGADGLHSTIARQSGLSPGRGEDRRAIIMTCETDYDRTGPAKNDTMYVFYGFGDSIGYGYVFPKKNSMDIGLGYLISYYRQNLTEGLRTQYGKFIQFLKANGFLRSDAYTKNIQVAMLPVGGPLKKTYTDRILLCGDAARFVNAFTAEGIYYAMVSGEIAANAASIAVEAGQYEESFLSKYQDKWYAEIGKELKNSVKIQARLFANTRLINFIVEEARENPKIKRMLTDYAIGHLDPPSMSKKLLLNFFPFLVKYQLARIFG
jgi:geranylgeranyl reductase family protein